MFAVNRWNPFEELATLRSFTIPSNVDGDQVSATYNHGMLEMTLPIAESAKPRRIEIGGKLEDIDVRKLA